MKDDATEDRDRQRRIEALRALSRHTITSDEPKNALLRLPAAVLKPFGSVVVAPVLLIMLSFAGCATSTAKTVPTATSSATSTIQTPAPTPTLPAFNVPPVWSLVLQLGPQPDGSITSGGTFVSSNTYAVLIACEGNGHVTVDYAPQGSARFVCSASLQSFGNQIGSPSSPPARQTITVSVTADAGVAWRGAIEVEQ